LIKIIAVVNQPFLLRRGTREYGALISTFLLADYTCMKTYCRRYLGTKLAGTAPKKNDKAQR